MIDPKYSGVGLGKLFADKVAEAEQSSKRAAALEASLSEASQEARRYCTERDALQDALHLAWGLVQWMSGSADFAPGGKSHDGWIKAQYDIDKIRHLIKAAAVQQEVKG